MICPIATQTSITLGWTLYLLANNPEVQEKLRREVQSVVGSEEIVTTSHISNMPYLRNCIKETLRYFTSLHRVTSLTIMHVSDCTLLVQIQEFWMKILYYLDITFQLG